MQLDGVPHFTLRSPAPDDLPAVFDLIARCEVDEYGEPDTDVDDLRRTWDEVDLAADAWLAFSPSGAPVGYAIVTPWGQQDLRYELFHAPEIGGPDLPAVLLAHCDVRGREIAISRRAAAPAQARVFLAHVNAVGAAVMRRAGYKPGRYYFQMQVELEVGPPEPIWPATISVRTADVMLDDRAIYSVIQSAFAQPGRTAPTFEDWQAWIKPAHLFDPGLWFLAFGGGELVGACLGFAYPGTGWVRQLGVLENWRRKGLGKALLQQAFGEFYRRGFKKVGLSVESFRPEAYLFYQQVGMRTARQYDEWVKPLP